MLKKMKALFKEEEGQGMTEYGLILGLIALAVIAALIAFRGQITALFERVQAALSSAS